MPQDAPPGAVQLRFGHGMLRQWEVVAERFYADPASARYAVVGGPYDHLGRFVIVARRTILLPLIRLGWWEQDRACGGIPAWIDRLGWWYQSHVLGWG